MNTLWGARCKTWRLSFPALRRPKTDISATVKALCNYSRTLHENLDYILNQLQKTSKQNTEDIAAIRATIQTMQSTMNSMQSSIESLGNSYNSLANRVTALEQAIQ